MSLVLLIVLLALLAAWVWRDFREYPKFKAYTDTRDRQRTFARWVLQSFALFCIGSIVCLALIGSLGAITAIPAQFGPVMRLAAPIRGEVGVSFLEGMAGSLIVAIVVLSFIGARSSAKQVVVGDIQALMPRNRAEYGWTAALSINAGVGEELFFRLLLPLLLTNVIGDALIATVIAAIVFGLAHLYQGWIGVIATGIVGAVMSGIYLATGSILWPILLHAAIDLRGLVLQPALTAFFRSRSSQAH